MWTEASNNLAKGAYGDPTTVDALLLYWTVLETFHYPSANIVRAQLQARKEAEIQAMKAQEQMLNSKAQSLQMQADETHRSAAINSILTQGNVPAANAP